MIGGDNVFVGINRVDYGCGRCGVLFAQIGICFLSVTMDPRGVP
jgi:hypothetical protein